MNNYEIMFIVKPDLKSEEKDKLLKQIDDEITKNQGKIDEAKVWAEKRELAYRIKKQDQGLYYLILFSLPPQNISKLKQLWKINDNILRFLVLRTS